MRCRPGRVGGLPADDQSHKSANVAKLEENIAKAEARLQPVKTIEQ